MDLFYEINELIYLKGFGTECAPYYTLILFDI